MDMGMKNQENDLQITSILWLKRVFNPIQYRSFGGQHILDFEPVSGHDLRSS